MVGSSSSPGTLQESELNGVRPGIGGAEDEVAIVRKTISGLKVKPAGEVVKRPRFGPLVPVHALTFK